MPERPVEQIRLEVESERQRLAADMDVLHAELRSLVKIACLGVVLLVLLLKGRRLWFGLKLLWKFR